MGMCGKGSRTHSQQRSAENSTCRAEAYTMGTCGKGSRPHLQQASAEDGCTGVEHGGGSREDAQDGGEHEGDGDDHDSDSDSDSDSSQDRHKRTFTAGKHSEI